jgi:hypothetical protein
MSLHVKGRDDEMLHRLWGKHYWTAIFLRVTVSVSDDRVLRA